MKRIVIIHYHLNPGGVTRIIESQIKSLKKYYPSQPIKVLAGHCENSGKIKSLGAEICINKKLNYLSELNTDLDEEYNSIHDFIANQINSEDILHVHNLNLGKNPLLTLAISDFTYKGYKVLNHAHDFAEDREPNLEFLRSIIEGKFGKAIKSILYPNLPNFFNAVLNSFDRRRLIDYGLPESRVFLLPNPVGFNQYIEEKDSNTLKTKICKQLNIDAEKKLVTYPVRVIRRKNIGEYIFLAALFSKQANWLVTQPPKNPVEIEHYEKWKDFCRKEKIKMIFEAGVKTDFEELIQANDYCFTTSVKEGFGMVYLEPWLFGTPVIGRNLPMITEDLKNFGIVFPLLYDRLKVPINKNLAEFSSLTDNEQKECIAAILKSESVRNLILSENPFLENLLNFKDENVIEKNKSIIKKEFSLKNYAERLEKIYQKFTGQSGTS